MRKFDGLRVGFAWLESSAILLWKDVVVRKFSDLENSFLI